MSNFVEHIPVIKSYKLPLDIRTYLDTAVVMGYYSVRGNDSYFSVDLAEFRECQKYGDTEYIFYGDENVIKFLTWLEAQTSADTVIVLYSW